MNSFETLNFDLVVSIVGILFLIILIFLLVYVALRDKDVSKKFIRIEQSIEDLNKEVYKIQKWIMESKNTKDPLSLDMVLKKDLDYIISTQKKELDVLNSNLQSDREYFENKILILEERLREMGHFGGSMQNKNEAKILQMFQDGHSIDKIAKELRMGKGEVEFILKLSDIK
ncbi:hypothetical protein BKH43_04780 [Helicobacter sp. 13S00401-1]|uniref:DUF6115 domain-containing protein n=1 Tax=Helicobacter sp. 13S00401-1 TaxID=1905758 RepID=UPI000BD794D0|nr:hypothetical protein [Helicobacter sp. 13S00401-1]PAF50410.1 hypothetical protein BKH43_04780 [Helicobacter sp. 13S00401-1]